MKFRKILCPIDFAPASEEAAAYAVSLGEHFDAPVTLLYVAPAFEVEYAMMAPAAGRAAQLAEHRNVAVRRALELFPTPSGTDRISERRLAEGEPSEQIVRIAREGGFDLIVMPTHGNNALRRWLVVGSVTTRVLHSAECPVISSVSFVGAHDSFQLYQVLCAVDMGPNTERVLCFAAGLAGETGARLTVVHATPGAGEAVEDFFDESWRITLKSRLTDKITSLLDKAGAKADVLVEPGDSYKVVSEAARRLSTNMVVIGRSTSTGLLGRLRAQAYEIIRRSPCPVLSV